MIEHNLDKTNGILLLRPKAALTESDFQNISAAVDPYIRDHGKLDGLIIEAPGFPGWDSLGAMSAHFRFLKDHHRAIKRVALVTDSAMGNAAQRLASHFVSAEIRHFAAGQLEAAKQWVMAGP